MSKTASHEVAFVRQEMDEALPPPTSERGVVHWIRKNLFSSPLNAILTVLAVFLIYILVKPILDFALFQAVWTGESREACATTVQGGVLEDGWFGACWPYIGAYSKLFVYGRYPVEELWRVNLVYVTFFVGVAGLAIPQVPFKREFIIFMLGIFPVAAFILLTGGHVHMDGFLLPQFVMAPSFAKFIVDFAILTGIFCGISALISRGTDSPVWHGIRNVLIVMGVVFLVLLLFAADFGLVHVETEYWGGLLVTLVIAVTGIVASLPIGILLALGRRSQMSAVRLVSIIFIEFWRGVPLISVLFMSSVMLPLFLPSGVEFDKLLRALIGVALFASAYMAEVIRGGIQALPKGQYEGAMALGLNYWQMMRMIILPQALKLVIPGIVNTFIGLFKDTTLVLIIGLFDFLGQIQNSYSDPTWGTPVQSLTGYLFAALTYWLFCFGMSRYSIYMENKLHTGHR